MPMRCYYEVLGVNIEADKEDLKKAYRTSALKWHPDKNVGQEKEAHSRFQEIQEAYNVLSDPHERAWYDKHRNQILNNQSEDEEVFNLFPYFTASCYTDFTDSPEGFYTVYRTVFENIAGEDEAAVGRNGFSAPTFGDSNSSYPEVVEPFYNFWSNYCTKRDYSWKDERISREYGRKAIRIIEKENSKRREKLKKERNEEVRNLVNFIKKRDKRVSAWATVMKEARAGKQMRIEELRREQINENKRQNESYQECDWSKFSTLEQELIDIEKHVDQRFNTADEDYSSSDEDEDVSRKPKGFFCVACNKLFQSEKAFANHEGSKKHKANVSKLQDDSDDEDSS